MRRYASSLGAAFREVDERVKNEFKKDIGAYNHARKASFEENIKRFMSGVGVSGSMTPSNISTNPRMEKGLLAGLGNAEKRLMFYGRGAA